MDLDMVSVKNGVSSNILLRCKPQPNGRGRAEVLARLSEGDRGLLRMADARAKVARSEGRDFGFSDSETERCTSLLTRCPEFQRGRGALQLRGNLSRYS